jgi:hypothetical protein
MFRVRAHTFQVGFLNRHGQESVGADAPRQFPAGKVVGSKTNIVETQVEHD